MAGNEKDLEYFTNLKYYIVVKKVKDKFVLYISELSLYEEDENLEKAYERLESEKGKYFQKMIEMEAQGKIAEPACIGGSKKTIKQLQNNLVHFFIKSIITIFIIAIFLIFLDDISSTFKHIRKASKKIEKTDFSRTLDVDKAIVKVLEALNKYEIAKEERKRLSKYQLLTPVDVYASNSLANYPVEFAFDSKRDTFWHSSEDEAHFIVKFKLPSKLYALSITSRPDLPGLQGPEIIIIEGSDDNKNWDHIDKISQLVWKQGETKIIPIESNSKNYMYYKFSCIRKDINDYISIVEMKLYGNYF